MSSEEKPERLQGLLVAGCSIAVDPPPFLSPDGRTGPTFRGLRRSFHRTQKKTERVSACLSGSCRLVDQHLLQHEFEKCCFQEDFQGQVGE